ncbi:DUF3445 domain-containing protein [Spirosoma sp. SC4-14]|uniref:heme-dependent oxidative N-demethylase family protein n=1 Tax=Spirosoma sp. SC4-14 TaxID=3128900 RepID=UPI0030D07E69
MLPYFPFGQRFNDKMGTISMTDADRLIEVDADYQSDVARKRALLDEYPRYYFQALPHSETAQWDAVTLILNKLIRSYPEWFSLKQTGTNWLWQNRLLNEETSFRPGIIDSLPLAPLDWVGRQVQEDLVVLSGNDITLIAGQLCFGNGWCLDEKIGLPFWQIHAPIVPIVEPMMVASQKLMQRLPAERPVWRLNWSIKHTDQLDMTCRHTESLNQLLADQLPTMTVETISKQLYLRIERQTLTRLPNSGAILFGIHTYQNRLDRELAERPEAARQLLNVLRTTPPAMIAYKGIAHYLPVLINYLNSTTI